MPQMIREDKRRFEDEKLNDCIFEFIHINL